MSGRLYKRNVRVTLARPTGFFEQEPNSAIQVTGLRVAFEIEKSLRDDPNTARVTITNLAERTRAEVQRKPLYVRLEAGYDGNLERLASGDVLHARSLRAGPDWHTEIQIGDGLRALRFARVNRSFKGGTNALAVVKEAARALGLTFRASTAVERELRAQYASGVVLDGSAADVMRRTLAPFGVSWSIQDGRLQILLPDEVRVDTSEILVSQDTGMIGSPEFGDPPRPGAPPVLTIKTLLYPTIAPGGRVRVDSRSAKGSFKVQRARHYGDTHGRDWYTEAECLPR